MSIKDKISKNNDNPSAVVLVDVVNCQSTEVSMRMEETSCLSYPYEFKPLDPEEQAEVDRVYGATAQRKCLRVGPKGYLVYEPFKKDAANIYNMPLRPDDTFVVSYQRSGTTWTQELVWLVANDFDYDKAAAIPLALRYPFTDSFMLFEEKYIDKYINAVKGDDIEKSDDELRELFKKLCSPRSGIIASMPSPRFIKSHLPLSLLNPKLLDTAKVVYIARDPRDVAVSCFHHARLFKLMRFPGGFKQFWHLFHRNLFTLLPYFEHVKEAWEQRHNPNMLFLFYEELSKDLPSIINRVADFLGKKVTQEQMDRLCSHLSIENFRKNTSINYENWRELGMLAKEETFIRKGKAGGWRDYFDEEMTQQAEQWIQDNLKDTDLRFPNM